MKHKSFAQLIAKYNELYIQYHKRICIKCLGTEQQKERKCGLLCGYDKPSCDHMERNIQRKLKPDKDEFAKSQIENFIKPKLKAMRDNQK